MFISKAQSNLGLACELRRGQVLDDRNHDNYDECTLRYRNHGTVKAVGALRPTPLPLRAYYVAFRIFGVKKTKRTRETFLLLGLLRCFCPKSPLVCSSVAILRRRA